MSWNEANKFCVNLGAEMVMFQTDEEFKEVVKMTGSLIKKKWRYWVDGKRINGSWKTFKGEKTPSFKWGMRRPAFNSLRALDKVSSKHRSLVSRS